MDSDAAVLTTVADKVLRVSDDHPYLVNLEFHTYYDADVVRTLWLRQAVLDHRHNLPVLSVLVLVRKQANVPRLRGVYDRRLPNGQPTNRYHYRVVRLWREDPEDYLTGGVSLMPLAPLTNISKADLPGVVRRMRERLEALPGPRADKLWDAAYFLAGARYPADLVDRLFQGGLHMLWSSTYEKVLTEGRVEGGQHLLLRMGTKRFGEPDAAIVTAIKSISDVDRLESLGLRIVDQDVRDWKELLQNS